MSEEKNKPCGADCAGNFYEGTGWGTCVKCMHQNPALDDHTDDDSDDYEDDDYFDDDDDYFSDGFTFDCAMTSRGYCGAEGTKFCKTCTFKID